MIIFENVDVTFGTNGKKVAAVKNANLSIRKGEIFVLMGMSGSGKSSLLRCINGLTKPSRGRVTLDGHVISDRKDNLLALRRTRVSMVFQQFALLPWRTVAQNVGLGLEVSGVCLQERERLINENIEKVGLSDWQNSMPSELSGGMQQRVGLARALTTNADILLMDEPFSALDPLMRNQLQDELLKLQRELQKTIVFVSHDLTEAVRIGSRIAVMEAGYIVQVGTPSEIMNAPKTDYVRRFVEVNRGISVL